MMLNIWKSLTLCAVIILIGIARIEALSVNSIDSNQASDAVDTQIDDNQNSYYDFPLQQQVQQESLYPSIPLDRLQMLMSRYSRPTAYMRSPSNAGMNVLYRLPESKRQIKYRQCYFNPISCFKK